ncbi:MAG: VF530 family protein [Bdellovibrionota bacterium]
MSDSDSDRKLPKKKFNKYPPAGITLEMMVRALVEEYGWAELGQKIYIRCFNENPSLKSSLKFLKETEWARLTVEDLYYWTYGGRPADWVGPKPRDDGDSDETE